MFLDPGRGGGAPRMPVNIIDHVLTNAHPCPNSVFGALVARKRGAGAVPYTVYGRRTDRIPKTPGSETRPEFGVLSRIRVFLDPGRGAPLMPVDTIDHIRI